MKIALFNTAIGTCGIAWNASGITRINLPEATPARTLERLNDRFETTTESVPSTKVRRVIQQITTLLTGKPVDLSSVLLDMYGVPPFHRAVYDVVRTIPAGRTLSYGEVARCLGKPGAARAVGQAMGRNPFPIIVPCHRVVAANGKPGGFSAEGGSTTKLRLLQMECGSSGLTEKPAPRGRSRKAVNAASPPAARTKALNVSRALTHLRAADVTMAGLIKRVGPCRLTVNGTQDLFLALAESIVYQQLHGKAAATIFRRVCHLFPQGGESFTASDIARCSDDKLRQAGLSRNKLLALRDLSGRVIDGSLPDIHALDRLDNETIIEQLTAVRGIGRWTVEMLLIFRLGRPDVLPVDDFGVRRGFMLTYQLPAMPSPKELRIYGERWAPYRSIAAWYLWRATEQKNA